MSELRVIEDGVEHEVAELLCVRCFNRWVGTYPVNAELKDLECSNCGHTGLIIKTGQTMFIRHNTTEQAQELEEGEPNE